ncbi:hypothetical protein Dda_5092 [Drechslerella dactyloides]|uniref:Uncharacterized protein n=1 Tax=Drechslerella dactyloides TaxID=74499 RepID=A0AAD6IXN6_DREDA|nr:hypothetical protein Dda_5092 [Drechslerella dactyloides]
MDGARNNAVQGWILEPFKMPGKERTAAGDMLAPFLRSDWLTAVPVFASAALLLEPTGSLAR